MGSSYSIPAKKHPELPLFTIDFYERYVNIFNADDEVLSICRNNLESSYFGIKEEKRLNDVVMLQCNKQTTNGDCGMPQIKIPENASCKFDGLKLIGSMCLLLKELLEEGCIKMCACNLNWYTDVDVWFFYKSPIPLASGDMNFCAIDLRATDQINLLKCPEEVVKEIGYTVNQHWERIEKSEGDFLFSHLKLKGNPWGPSADRKSVNSCLLVLQMMRSMGSLGWVLYSSCNLDGRNDTLFFCQKKEKSEQCNLYSSVFAISLNRADRLRVIKADKAVVGCVKRVVEKNWKRIQQEIYESKFTEFKLSGTPWKDERDKCVPAVFLLCAIFTELRALGWVMFSNIEVISSSTAKGVFCFCKERARQIKYCAISFKRSGLIYGVNVTEEIQEALTEVFKPYFAEEPVIVEMDVFSAMKWSLNGNPWSTRGTQALKFNGQLLVANIIHILMGFNYHMCNSAHVSGMFRISRFVETPLAAKY